MCQVFSLLISESIDCKSDNDGNQQTMNDKVLILSTSVVAGPWKKKLTLLVTFKRYLIDDKSLPHKQ